MTDRNRGGRNQGGRATIAWGAAMMVLVVLGGGSALFPSTRMLTELIGVALLAVALWRDDAGRGTPRASTPLWLLAALAGLFVLHLIPLPPALWTLVPGRDIVADGDRLLFDAMPWRALSIDPDATIRSALMLIPAVALFVAGWRGSEDRLYALVAGFLAAVAISLSMALIQFASGGAVETYFYPTLHNGLPTGIFANRNHQGALFVIAAPFAAALIRRRGVPDLRGAAIAATVLVLCAIGTLITGSRTAAALLPVGLAGAVLILLPPVPPRRLAAIGGGLFVLALGAIVLMVAMGGDALGLLGGRATPIDDSRFNFWPAVWAAGTTSLPLGMGIGTFRAAYDLFEPAHLIAPLYVAHAHNDYLEILLEAGLPGLALVAAFLGWTVLAGLRMWRSAPVHGPWPLGRAATIAVVIFMLHSLTDYPLRTTALSALFGLSCAVLGRTGGRQSHSILVNRGFSQ